MTELSTTPKDDVLEKARARQASRDGSGVPYVEGSIYDGMAACVMRSGRTLCHVAEYADAVEIAAALATTPRATVEAQREAVDPTFGELVQRVRYAVDAPDGQSFLTRKAALTRHDMRRILATLPASDDSFQKRVQPWLIACFGEMIAGDREERNHRFLEEALELVQSCGCTDSEAHQLVDYVFGRDIGEPSQEVGGVMVTLAALCLANGLDMHENGEAELARIWAKVEAIRAKQAAKPKHSPLPEHVSLPATVPSPPTERMAEILGASFVPKDGPKRIATVEAQREAIARTLERLRWKLGHVSIDAMDGDNLAVTLCTRFDDADGEQDENGWTDAAVAGCDATLAAIHSLYSDAILATLPASDDAIAAKDAEIARLREALEGVRADILHERNTQSIVCTVWHGAAETTVDFIDATLNPAPVEGSGK